MARYFLMLLLLAPALAQAQETPLEDYVYQGLQHNLTLRQQQLDLDYSRYQVDEARGQYLPSMNFEARYTRAGGGRTIEFPVGDLLNPAYGALNGLLEGQGQPGGFPAINNEQFSLLRPREQETKFRLIQPVYQPALRQNIRIRSHLTEAQQASVGTTKRDLVVDIKTAYYNYLRDERLIEIFESTQDLVAENLRVNTSLSENGKATRDVVYRAQAEVSAVAQQLAEAKTQRDLAVSYFNLLLNRPLDAPIERTALDVMLPAAELSLKRFVQSELAPGTLQQDVTRLALAQRDELSQLSYAAEAAEDNMRLARSSFLPNVSFVMDLGIQGSGYSFSSESDFRAASVVMSWNLFNGFRDRSRVQQARVQQQALDAQREETTLQIRLQVQDAFDKVAVAQYSIQTAEDRVSSARQSFRLVKRKYEEGMASPVDFIDARTALTTAELNLAITQYDLLTRYGELERAAALYPL